MFYESIIKDLIIGLVSGSISSLIVSIILKKQWDARELANGFENDKQAFARYIGKLREELLIGNKLKDYSFFLRTLEDEPIRNSFEIRALANRKIHGLDGLFSWISSNHSPIRL